MLSITDTIFFSWHFSRFYWTKNKKDAFWVKNQTLKKKIFFDDPDLLILDINVKKIQKSATIELAKQGIKKLVLVPKFNFWNKIFVIIPFFAINANLVKFRHFQKNYLQMKFSLIKKSENEYFGQITKKSFWFRLQLAKISGYFDQKQKILPLSNFSLWLFLRQNISSVKTEH